MQSSSLFRSLTSQRSLLAVVASVVCVGTLLSVYIFVHSQKTERTRIEAEFDRRADVRNALTREIISYYESGVYVIKNLFEGSEKVSREEFRKVASDILTRFPGITALEWLPIVTRSDRAAFEASIAAEIGQPFQFTEPAPDGTMVRARDRAEHYPIVYVEPMTGNERAFGYDVQAAPTLPFLEQARRSRKIVVSSQFKLVQSRSGIVVIWPVFGSDPTEPSGQRFRGFVQGVYRIDEMLRTTELRSPASSTEMLYIDDTAPSPADRILYFRGPDERDPNHSEDLEAEFRRGLYREYSVDFGGRRWVILYRPSAAWLSEQSRSYGILWLTVGLLVTALVAGLMAALAKRATAIQLEVAERTAELSENRRYLSSLLHALPGMAYRCLYKDKLRVVYLSEGVLDLTGYRAEEFTSGQIHFRDLIHAQDLALVRTATHASLKNKRDVEVEYRIHPRCGSDRWILSRGRGVYDEQGELLFFEGLAIDITARKQAEADKLSIERKLLESQKLESLGLLAGGIAHDFNNLLTSIMGHANLARFHPEADPEVTDHLSKIELGAARAAELCQQMLAYSGRGNFLIAAVDLNQLISETLPLIQGSLPSRARLNLNLSAESAVVMADATQLRQIAMNLILNAADALGAAGGEITLISGRKTFGHDFLATAHAENVLPPGEYVFLEVQDNGCGMSAETMSKIFDPFFTTKFTGRGLGLAAVLGIVRGHSGALQVQSVVGCGSTFTLILPPSHHLVARSVDPAPTTRWQRPGRVLVIDDEQSVRNVAAALLRTFGLTVVTASNGTDGIELYRQNPAAIDLVLLDLTMPGLDGEDTLAGLRAITSDVRVLLVSGYSENDRISQLAANGHLLFLQKPFTRGYLEQKLQEIFPDAEGSN